jgi:hypothetical protein
MANLSNINNKFLVTTGGNILIGQTADDGNRLQVTGSSTFAGNVTSGGTFSSTSTGRAFSTETATNVLFSNVGGAFDIIFGDGGVRYYSLHTPTGAATGSIRNYNSNDIITWKQTGEVGIGTNTPNAPLQIASTNKTINGTLSGSNLSVYTTDTQAANVGASIGLGGMSTTPAGFEFYGTMAGRKENSTNLDSSGYLAFYTQRVAVGHVERMRIDSLGNVGIGTISPNQQLELMGNNAYTSKTRFSYGVGATNYFADWGYNSGGNKVYLTITDGGVAKDVIVANYTGNVGIGTTSPDLGGVSGTRVLTIASPESERWGILELAGNRTWGGNQVGEIKFISTDTTNNGTLVSLTAFNDSTSTGTGGGLRFNTRPNGGSLTERMSITGAGTIKMTDENGGVPILQVRNFATTATGGFTNAYAMEFRGAYTGGSTGGMMLLHMNEADDARATLKVSDSNGIFTTFVNGKVGIGTTSPQTKLDVHGPTGTRNRNTQGSGSSVYETSLYWGANGNTTTNVSINTSTVFPPMGSSGFILVEVSASGYGNSGSNGLIFSYITGGYGGHYAALNQPYHPVTITANTMMAGTCTWYNPSSGIIGITVAPTNSQGITGVMRVKVTTTY